MTMMIDQDPNDFEATGPDSANEGRNNGHDSEINQPIERPYGDAGNLYEIPSIRSDDPPMRRWWIDDETKNNGSQEA